MLEVRSTGTVPSEVVAEVLGMLDVEESMLDEIRETRDVDAALAASESRARDVQTHATTAARARANARAESREAARDRRERHGRVARNVGFRKKRAIAC